MFKLVVLSALLAVASSKPSGYHGEFVAAAQVAHAVPVATASSYQSRTDVINKPVVATYAAPAVATYAAAPVVATYAAAPVATYAAPVYHGAVAEKTIEEYSPVVKSVQGTKEEEVNSAEAISVETPANTYTSHAFVAPAVTAYAAPALAPYAAPALAAYATVPVTGTAYTQNVHYAEKDVVTGYNSEIIKPNLGAPSVSVHNEVLQRAVHTITPTVTKVEPEISVKSVKVDIPVHTPVVSQVEVRTPVVQAAQVATYAAPAVSTYAAAPAVTTYAAGPAVATYAAPAAVATYSAAAPVAYAAHNVVGADATYTANYKTSPVVSTYAAAAPAVATYAAAAPAVATYAAPALATYSAAAPVAYAAHNVVEADATYTANYKTSPAVATFAAAAPAVATYAAGPVAYSTHNIVAPAATYTAEYKAAPVEQKW